VTRHYRGALQVLGHAVSWWSEIGDTPPSLVAQLGDLIDGKNAALGQSQTALDAALAHLNRIGCPKLNLLGNHELYNFDRSTLRARLNTAPSGREYYSLAPTPGVRLIVLDPYAESIILPEAGSAEARLAMTQGESFQKALALLRANNPNDVLSNADWTKGLTGPVRRYVPYNGAMGAAQQAWLRQELVAAAAARERVVILSHVVLHPEACDGSTMAFDYDEALEAIASSNVVVAVLCGHDHKGRYHRDAQSGVHHITFQSPLNKGTAGHAYGLVTLLHDRLVIRSPALADFLPADALAQGTLPQLTRLADGSEAIELPIAA